MSLQEHIEVEYEWTANSIAQFLMSYFIEFDSSIKVEVDAILAKKGYVYVPQILPHCIIQVLEELPDRYSTTNKTRRKFITMLDSFAQFLKSKLFKSSLQHLVSHMHQVLTKKGFHLHRAEFDKTELINFLQDFPDIS